MIKVVVLFVWINGVAQPNVHFDDLSSCLSEGPRIVEALKEAHTGWNKYHYLCIEDVVLLPQQVVK